MSDQIECDRCGRSIVTEDAVGMLAAISGPCPSCGGRFRLTEPPSAPVSKPEPARRRTG